MSNPNIPTPHITAKEGDFARTVLMPGDPLRSKFIAETYLENPVLVNDTRGVQGYTVQQLERAARRNVAVKAELAAEVGIGVRGQANHHVAHVYAVGQAGKNALAICTISDHLSKNESLDAQARQSSFTQMMEIALDIA